MPLLLATRATFCNELRLLLRDPFCVALLACFSAGLAWASWNSHRHWQDFSIQQSERQSSAREKWLSQFTTNAHMATHVGQTVYKPISPLADFDPGAVSNFGSSIFLQSHRQSAAKNNPREDKVDLLQNEAYSPAVLLELIGPLLIIVLGVASIARDKEAGTLSILLTTGSPWPAVVTGKGLAVLLALLVVAAPGLLLLAFPWFEGNRLLQPPDLVIRETAIIVALAAYYVGWLGTTVFVSSKSRSMTGGFSILIAVWSVFALVMPRIAGDVATFVSPLPTNAEIRLEKENVVHDANQSSVQRTQASRALEARLLEEFQVERIEDLPIDLAGAKMIDQEANANRLYDEVDQRVTQAKHRQNELIGGFQFASPYMAMRAVSTSLAATDRSHHFDFVNAAETHRRQFVKDLNVAEMKKLKPGSSPAERRQFWGQVSEFLPSFVSAMESVKRSLAALICLIIWAIVASVASVLAAPKINRMR